MKDIAEAVAGCWLLVNLGGIAAVSVGLTWRWIRTVQERRGDPITRIARQRATEPEPGF